MQPNLRFNNPILEEVLFKQNLIHLWIHLNLVKISKNSFKLPTLH